MLCTSGFTDEVMFSYHGIKGRTALDKIRLHSRLTSSTLAKPSIPSVTSDNYSALEMWHRGQSLLSMIALFNHALSSHLFTANQTHHNIIIQHEKSIRCYHAMHYSAKRGLAIACHLCVHLSVCL